MSSKMFYSKEELMKPVKLGGTDWETANKYRRNIYIFLKKLIDRIGM